MLPPSAASARMIPLGQDPEDTIPVRSGIAVIEAVLRHPRRLLYQMRNAGGGRLIAALLFATVLCSALYGLVVGSFSGGIQLWAAPLKITIGLLLSAAICLPSLYIFACLSGSSARLSEIAGFVAGLLVLTGLLLIGFAPVAWLFAQSTESVVWMGLLHLVFWSVATLFGLKFLRAGFAHTQARSNAGLAAWVIVFILVALQMSTALRPIVGHSESFLPSEKKFFLAHWGDCIDQANRDNVPRNVQTGETSTNKAP